MTELTPEQLSAIDITLAKAPKIQEDLKAEYGYGENKFFDLDLIEYRINNSLLDIAEDLDVKSRYGLTTDKVAENSVGLAFRGHHDEDFKPDYQFEGLFSEEMNDMIEEIRKSEGGQITWIKGVGVHGRSKEQKELDSQKGYANGLANLTPEARIGNSRKANEAQGNHLWSLEEIVDIHNFREESFNHSSKYRPNSPSWDYTTSKMNEKYGEDWTTKQVKLAYHRNKDLLADEEE